MATSWFTELEGFFTTTETDVVNLIAKIKQGVDVAQNDIHGVVKWVANNAPAIASDIQQVLLIVQALGVVSPQVELAIAAANAAVVALNAFAAAQKAGQSDATSVIAGYTAVKQAQAAVAQAGVAAANAKAPAASMAVAAAA